MSSKEIKFERGLERPAVRSRVMQCRARSGRGFTLLELAMVMAVILILVSITFPAYQTAIRRSREAVLRDDLTTMRQVIDEFTVDKQHPPESLDQLVEAGYIHAIPTDPFTGAKDSWQPDIEEVPVPPDQNATGVVDVHSGSDAEALDGTHYNTW
ncbi:MAG TPA: prepilin-type N-terminal cleavage/methylation domain-containing protein [Terriglobia bacterium]|nr:prepilin-type N-terminal cleavage/methylation domain-containing protein [Terriglobia bacterium]